MKYPNFNEEKKLWKKGYEVAGMDEAGRGPLAGPVVACALIVKNFQFSISNLQFPKIRDSKKLTPKKREEIFEILKKSPQIEWGIGRVGEKIIDRINILEATKLAMKRAVKKLEKKLDKVRPRPAGRGRTLECFLILDGNFGINLDVAQKSIIKADEKVFSCVYAGLIAKVIRDRMMFRYHKKYPQYGFDRHKGYPTKLHKEMIKKYGYCKIHRRSFNIS